MTWDEAFAHLAAGNPVYRESWTDDEEYLEAAFKKGAPDAGYPHSAVNGGAFRIERYSSYNPTVTNYTPTAEEFAATDWVFG